ncbi:Acg family FMN-binding oxidoreductase [Streptomyces umbrinus]|uniref:Acg family FMN-binding oxidoreductase n=1 Tax=Streptomyces umbrinus TaxID=67370 RepID=UPI0033FFA9B2
MQSTSFDAVTLETCVAAAAAAPSILNTQPWHFQVDPGAPSFHVRAAPERGLRRLDPTGRALHLSVGACVLNLRVATAHFGRSPDTRLLPCPGDPELLAVIRPTGPAAQAGAGRHADLYEAIWRRHSSRTPFSGTPLASSLSTALGAAAASEGARLVFPPPEETGRFLRLTAEAEQRNHLDADRAMESRRWVRHDPYETADVGLSQSGLGPQDARELLPMRDFTAQLHRERLLARPFEVTPVLALLSTDHDRRIDWLRAGQALERVLLVATTLGLRTSLLHQAMEWPDLRRELAPSPDRTGHAQMLIRLGCGTVGPATPRRAARTLIEDLP